MAEIIVVTDLPSAFQTHELVATMVAGANAKASRVAPCLVEAVEADEPTAEQQAQLDEAKLVLVGAVKRWAEAGAGSFTQNTAGPFSIGVDTRQRTGFNLWPSEIEALQGICTGEVEGKAFEVDTMPADSGAGRWSAPDVWTPLV